MGCGGGSALDATCQKDSDCPTGYHCVVGTGACVRFTTPLDDAGAKDASSD